MDTSRKPVRLLLKKEDVFASHKTPTLTMQEIRDAITCFFPSNVYLREIEVIRLFGKGNIIGSHIRFKIPKAFLYTQKEKMGLINMLGAYEWCIIDVAATYKIWHLWRFKDDDSYLDYRENTRDALFKEVESDNQNSYLYETKRNK